MPVANVNLLIDDVTYAKVKAGTLELCGMVKDQKHKIRGHLPTVSDSAKEGAAKAIDFVREHKKGMLLVGGVVIAGGFVVGAAMHFAHRDQKKAEKKFGKSLQAYIDAAQNGKLTLDLLDTLISDLEEVSKSHNDGAIPINMSAKQLNQLFNSIYDYTQRMAEANAHATTHIRSPKRGIKNGISNLHHYLEIQRQIIQNAA